MKLFMEDLRVLNVGLASFGDAIAEARGKAVQIEWTPPASGDAAVGRARARLVNHKDVEAANRKASLATFRRKIHVYVRIPAWRFARQSPPGRPAGWTGRSERFGAIAYEADFLPWRCRR